MKLTTKISNLPLTHALLTTIAMASLPFPGWSETPGRAALLEAEASAAGSTDSAYTDVEQRAWEQFRRGKEIRLHGKCPDWRTRAEEAIDRTDRSHYTLSGPFVAQLLTRTPPRRLTDPPAVKIHGARIAGDVVIEGGVTSVPVNISCSTIEGDVRFQDWHGVHGLDFSQVRITGSVKLYDVRAESLVAFAESDVVRVTILRSRFARDLSFRGTRVRTELKIVSTRTEGSLLMGCRVSIPNDCCCASYGQTTFLDVSMNGLDMIGSRFVKDARFEGMNVGASVQASHTRSDEALKMLNSDITGGLYITQSVVKGPLVLSATAVRAGMHLGNSTLPKVTIHRSEINRYIDFGDSTLRSLNLEGTSVDGELRMGTVDAPVSWGDPGTDAGFIGRNTRVESLHDTTDTWPPWLRRELDGFEYDSLSGVTDAGLSAYLRGAEWFIEWLAGDDTYSPQPYRNLYAVLLREGQRNVANEIAYAAKERERTSLPRLSADRLWLSFLCYSIGYGIGLKPFRVLWWMLFLVLIGWGIAFGTAGRQGGGPWPSFWYSMAYTLPGLDALKDHELEGVIPLRSRRWFAFQRLFCVALASFAGAAAVGLVQA